MFDERTYYRFGAEEGDGREPHWPATMRELFDHQSFKETGTHSVLDMCEVIRPEAPDGIATLRLLGPEETAEYFGSSSPSPDDFENGVEELWRLGPSRMGRWRGYAVVLYEHDAPSQLGIWGISGD